MKNEPNGSKRAELYALRAVFLFILKHFFDFLDFKFRRRTDCYQRGKELSYRASEGFFEHLVKLRELNIFF